MRSVVLLVGILDGVMQEVIKNLCLLGIKSLRLHLFEHAGVFSIFSTTIGVTLENKSQLVAEVRGLNPATDVEFVSHLQEAFSSCSLAAVINVSVNASPAIRERPKRDIPFFVIHSSAHGGRIYATGRLDEQLCLAEEGVPDSQTSPSTASILAAVACQEFVALLTNTGSIKPYAISFAQDSCSLKKYALDS